MVKFNNIESVKGVTLYDMMEEYTIIKFIYDRFKQFRCELVDELEGLDFVDFVEDFGDELEVNTKYIKVTIDKNGVRDNFTIYHVSDVEIWNDIPTCDVSTWAVSDALNTIDLIFN